jgi:voltage-gated potassium channel Kch
MGRGLNDLRVGMAIFLISSDPVFWRRPDPGFESIEWIVIVVFTLDYFVRMLSAPAPLRWCIQLASLLDLLSILPFYVEKFTATSLGSFAALRGFRALRVFRLFRVARITSRLRSIVWSSIRKSIEGMLLLCFFIIISLFIFSTAMFYAEQSVAQFNEETRTWMRDGHPSPFQSIHGTFWWAMVTLTTVGYGDAVPTSGLGKFVASLTIIIGILLMAFPVTIFTSQCVYTVVNRQRHTSNAAQIQLL